MAISGIQEEELPTSRVLILRREAFFQTHDSLKNITKNLEEPELSFQSREGTGMERSVVKNIHGKRQGFPPSSHRCRLTCFPLGSGAAVDHVPSMFKSKSDPHYSTNKPTQAPHPISIWKSLTYVIQTFPLLYLLPKLKCFYLDLETHFSK